MADVENQETVTVTEEVDTTEDVTLEAPETAPEPADNEAKPE